MVSVVAMQENDDDDDPGGGHGERQGRDETAHGTDLPVEAALGKRARVVAAGTLRPVVAAHTTDTGSPVVGRVESGQRDSETLTSGPATTGRIAISHSDHLRRS
jgi:hypothetical protein